MDFSIGKISVGRFGEVDPDQNRKCEDQIRICSTENTCTGKVKSFEKEEGRFLTEIPAIVNCSRTKKP
jgi:hypothetical protein